jgi:hypothetical protein
LGRRVDLEVIHGVSVDSGRLRARQPQETVTASLVPLLGYFSRTPDAYPDDVEAGQRIDPVVPTRPIDDDFVHDDVQTDASCRRYPAWYARSTCLPTPPARTGSSRAIPNWKPSAANGLRSGPALFHAYGTFDRKSSIPINSQKSPTAAR